MNVRRKSRGNRFWFELARDSSKRGFELSGVDCIINKDALLTKHEVKMTRCRQSSFLFSFIDRDEVEVSENAKKKEANIQSS